MILMNGIYNLKKKIKLLLYKKHSKELKQINPKGEKYLKFS